MKKKPSLIAVAALSLFLVACGDKQSTTSSAPPAAAPAAPAASAPAPEAPTPVAAAPESAPAAAAPAATTSVADNTVGKSVYGKTCALCHGAGIAGAPKPGDKEDWGPRIAQGKDTLYKHAIEGYTGAKGMMPPRGGGAKLTDEEVKAAVDFMADQSV